MGWHDYLIEDDEGIREILRTIRKIAVIGIKDETHENEAAHSVPKYLKSKGYKIFGVNPNYDTVFGEPCYDTVHDLPEPVDAVLIFRRPGNVSMHADQILAMEQKPKVVWMQTGIRNMEAAHKLARAGIKVVQDHCMYMEHLRLIRQPVPSTPE